MPIDILHLRTCQVDLRHRRIIRNGETLRITGREAALLRYLAERPDVVVSREELLREVWGYAVAVVSRAVDKTVSRLRAKVEQDRSDPDHLLTEYGLGFRLVLSPSTAPIPRARAPVAEALVAPEPFLPPAPPTRHNLPAERDAFIGRTAALKTLQTQLSGEERLVSVLGTGGTGKTRLVLHYAWQQHTRWPGGVWFCDLSEVRDLAGVVSAVARVFRVPLGKAEPVDRLGHAIAGRGRCLVILDNFEQLVRLSAVVSRWLDLTTDARFVVTTRHLLGLVGEVALPLPPLPSLDAAALFVARARSATPLFMPNHTEQEAIDTLVALLDHLPLTIELAAARVRILSPSKLLARMSDRFRLLVSRNDRPDRQATLRATLDWSWELLSGWEKAALAQMSVFDGSFDLEAAESVLDLGDDPEAPWAVDVLQSLVDKSLLRTVEQDRFSLLVSVQEYAAEKLAAQGGQRAAEARHGVFYAALSTTEVSSILEWARTAASMPILTRENNNLMRACERAVARRDQAVAVDTLVAVWVVRELTGPFDHGRQLANAVLEAFSWPTQHHLQQAQVHYIAGQACRLQGHLNEARTHYQHALERYRATRSQREQAIVMDTLANLYRAQGQFDDAQLLFEQALTLHRADGDRNSEGRALTNQGILYAQTGRFAAAQACLEQSLAIQDAIGARHGMSVAQINLGNLYRSHGRHAEAMALFENALDTLRSLGNHHGQGFVLGNLGNLHRVQGNLEQTRECYAQAIVIYRAVGDRIMEALSLGNMGSLNQSQGRFSQARTNHEHALAIYRALGEQRGAADSLRGLGEVMLRQDDHHAARAFFESALSHAPTSSPLLVGAIFSALALLEARDGRVEEARRLLAESTPLLATGGKQPEVVRCTARRAETAFWLGDIAAARAFLAEAEALCGSGPIFDDEILYALSAAQSCLSGTAEHSGQAI